MEIERKATLLLVDDEVNILNALRRLLRPLGCRVLVAESGAAGLGVLEKEKIDLVISDMRMPEMSGAQFLEEVRRLHPEVMRILLTGYSDMNSTVAAINRGEIYRYISKPWDDNDVLLAVRHALEKRFLVLEKNRLEELTRRQNEELKELNAGLEAKVAERTEEIRRANDSLESANRKLKENFLTSLKVFSSLIELRGGGLSGHSRRVAEHARRLALQMGLPASEVQDILFAALLHDIGKIGLPDNVIAKPVTRLNAEERVEMAKHTKTGQAALMGMENLKNAARFIRSHHERFDGLGYPDGLQGLAIPLGARILAVANEYDGLMQGAILPKQLSASDACNFLLEGRGRRYDPQVVDAFIAMLGVQMESRTRTREMKVGVDALRPLMVLSRDLMAGDGLLLLSKDYVLDESLIEQIRGYQESTGKELGIYVRIQGD